MIVWVFILTICFLFSLGVLVGGENKLKSRIERLEKIAKIATSKMKTKEFTIIQENNTVTIVKGVAAIGGRCRGEDSYKGLDAITKVRINLMLPTSIVTIIRRDGTSIDYKGVLFLNNNESEEEKLQW